MLRSRIYLIPFVEYSSLVLVRWEFFTGGRGVLELTLVHYWVRLSSSLGLLTSVLVKLCCRSQPSSFVDTKTFKLCDFIVTQSLFLSPRSTHPNMSKVVSKNRYFSASYNGCESWSWEGHSFKRSRIILCKKKTHGTSQLLKHTLTTYTKNRPHTWAYPDRSSW